MFWKKKEEKMINTKWLGPISKSTIENNGDLILAMYKKLIEEVKDKHFKLYDSVVNDIDYYSEYYYGIPIKEGQKGYLDYRDTYKRTSKSRKLKSDILKSMFKKSEFVKNIDMVNEIQKEMKELGFRC